MSIINRVLSRNPPKILSKKENYNLYKNGFLGNKPLCWDSIKDIEDSDWKGKICMRSKLDNKKITAYNLTLNEVKEKIKEWEEKGIPRDKITFNQKMPDHTLRIQGEVKRSFRGLELRYTKANKPMKQGLKIDENHAYGLEAYEILKYYLFSRSYDDIKELLRLFPDSIIEFSSYDITIGNRPNRNTVIWEVRNY